MTDERGARCVQCRGAEARIFLDGTPLCDGCHNGHLSTLTGWSDLPAPPAPDTLRAPDGRVVRIGYRLTWAPSGAMCAEAEQLDLPPDEGFRFAVHDDHDADPEQLLARLRRIVEREVTRAYLEPLDGDAGPWAIAGSELAGRITWSGGDAGSAPSVVVDGRVLSWDELGRMLASFEGWWLWMQLDDSAGEAGVGTGDDGTTEGNAMTRHDDDGAEVVPLHGGRRSSHAEPATPSIDDALSAFLAAQQERLAPSTFARYDDIVDLLRHCLNSYGHTSLSGRDAKVWREAFDAGDEEAFTRLLGPELIVESYGEFLGYFMVRKVAASKQQLKDAGTVTKRLARWLAEQGYVASDTAEVARQRAADAGRELPRAEELGDLLFLAAKRTELPGHPDDIPDEDWVEDLLPITRVEPGRLWLGDHGPIAVPAAASDLAVVGWEVSVTLARLDGAWRLVEVGSVYP